MRNVNPIEMLMNIRKDVLLLFLVIFAIFPSAVQSQTVMQALRDNDKTTHFAEALENTNLDERLKQSGPFTLFVPTNATFDKLNSGQKSNVNLLLNHIFTGMATERSLRAMSDITCLSGQTITVDENNGRYLTVNSIVISTPNIKADNGVIHVINGVIK